MVQSMITIKSIKCVLLMLIIGCSSNKNTPDDINSNVNTPLPSAGLNILFIGNSLTYSNDLPAMLERLLRLADVEVGHFESQTLPNYGLPDHWQHGETRAQMRRQGWDIFVLQQGPSATEGRPYLLEYAPLFSDEADKVSAKTALYMVWPSRQRFFDFPGVSDSYWTAAVKINGQLYPAGQAWLEAWSMDPDIGLYAGDGFHPSVIGTYLAALTMFEQLSGHSLNDLPDYIPASSGDIQLDPSVATMLRQAASTANAKWATNYPSAITR